MSTGTNILQVDGERLWQTLMRSGEIGPGRAGVFVNLVPVFASLLAVAWLREVFELFHAAALGLVLGGIWLSERGKAR